jgi:hypothetical protein
MSMASKFGFECRHRYRELAVILSMMALLFCARDVFGQGLDADRVLARARMAEGRARRSANDLQGALESFRAADSLLHFPTTGLEVARAEADLGLLLQARTTLRGFLDIPEPSNDLPQFKKARALATALLVEIERTIPTMRITVTGAPAGTAFALALDGVTIAPTAAAEPQQTNPGHHVVVATAVTGEAKEEVDLEAHESKEIRISLPARPAPPSAAGASTVSVPATEVVPSIGPSGATRAPATKTDRTLVFVGFGVACGGAAVSVIAGLSSISHTRSAESGCSGGRCPPPTHDDLQTAHTLATVSNISLIVAGVGVGAGIIGLLQKPKAARAAPGAAVTPWLALGAAGVNGTF